MTMTTRKKNELKQRAKRIVAWVLALLLIGGAVFSSVVSMIHFH